MTLPDVGALRNIIQGSVIICVELERMVSIWCRVLYTFISTCSCSRAILGLCSDSVAVEGRMFQRAKES